MFHDIDFIVYAMILALIVFTADRKHYKLSVPAVTAYVAIAGTLLAVAYGIAQLVIYLIVTGALHKLSL